MAKGPTTSPNDFGIAAVVDGSILKLTPLRNANIPPPMALHELNLQQDAIDVAISRSSTQLAILDRSHIKVYKYSITPKSVKQPELCSEHPLLENCLGPVQIAWRGENEVFLLASDAGSNRDALYLLDIEAENWVLVDSGLDHIATIFSSQDYDEVYVQSSLGLVIPAGSASGANSKHNSVKLPVLSPWAEAVTIGEEVSPPLYSTNFFANVLRT